MRKKKSLKFRVFSLAKLFLQAKISPRKVIRTTCKQRNFTEISNARWYNNVFISKGTDVCVIGSDNCDKTRSHCVISTNEAEDFYRCGCNDGYNTTYNTSNTTSNINNTKATICLDFCEQGIDKCNRKSTNCTATPGVRQHYNCTCKTGYSRVDDFNCTISSTMLPDQSLDPKDELG